MSGPAVLILVVLFAVCFTDVLRSVDGWLFRKVTK